MRSFRPASPRVEFLLSTLVMAFAVWTAHFWHFRRFGLYEDDWGFIGTPLAWDWHTAARTILQDFATWPQGRPIGFAGSALLAFLSVRVGGVPGAYLAAFLLQTATAVLFWRAVRRCLPAPAALCGALVFSLLPSNTSATLLTNSFMPGLSLFFLAAALHLYLSGRHTGSYLLALSALLSYENCFLPFFAVPLLEAAPFSALRRRLARHWAILLGMAAVVFAVRARMGESKVAALAGGLAESLARIPYALYLGPRTTLRAYLLRPLELWRARDLELTWVAVGAAAVFAAVLWRLNFQPREVSGTGGGWCPDTRLRSAIAGAVMFVAAYGLAITAPYYPPLAMNGRVTALHFGAAVGCGFLGASLYDTLRGLAGGRLARTAVIAAAAVYLAVLTGFQHRVQLDFIRAWDFQRTFWQSVTDLCPDVTDRTLIVYETESLPLGYVLANSWADPTILDRIYSFPRAWKQAPRVFSLPKTWRDDVSVEGGELTWSVPVGLWPAHREILPRANLILLTGRAGDIRLARSSGVLRLKEREFPLKPLGAPALRLYSRGPLYDLLLGP
ncbi:MAG TPA: hypothetical protein VFA33_11935 [Bryobacteraceae bacterium]|nr:hypothetical protein [Bryobacteraceae bacterium]